MDFKKSVMNAIEIVKLNGSVMTKVAADKDATGMGVLIIAIAGVAAAIGALNPFGIIMMPIAYLIGTFIGIGIIHLLAKLFGGKAKFSEFYRTSSHAYVVNWIAIIPILGPMVSGIAGLWNLVVTVFVLKNVHKLTTGKAVVVVLIPVVIAIIIGVVAAAAIIAMFAGVLGGSI